ncbi:Protein of unknown function [Gryllus bimaculatus]|nr:Protein of unknown function [Gryllus bimaculatus]
MGTTKPIPRRRAGKRLGNLGLPAEIPENWDTAAFNKDISELANGCVDHSAAHRPAMTYNAPWRPIHKSRAPSHRRAAPALGPLGGVALSARAIDGADTLRAPRRPRGKGQPSPVDMNAAVAAAKWRPEN